MRGVDLVKALPHISKSAVYNAIPLLERMGVLSREKGKEYTLNFDSAGLHSLIRFHHETLLAPLVNGLSNLSLKIILFGSRAQNNYHSDSDFDLFVATSHAGDVRQIIGKNSLADRIQLIIKTPEEWIDLHERDPELYRSFQKGIVLWDQNLRSVSKRGG